MIPRCTYHAAVHTVPLRAEMIKKSPPVLLFFCYNALACHDWARCGSSSAKDMDLAALSVQGDSGFLLAQGKNCLMRGQGRMRSSADMQASAGTPSKQESACASRSKNLAFAPKCMIPSLTQRTKRLFCPPRQRKQRKTFDAVVSCRARSRAPHPVANPRTLLLVGVIKEAAHTIL